ncbi:hypothetical protein B0H12DRAFT_1079714 [Mycena haematopus]|nr:hypothetical protein B0H12DRAFT_1079714 [Mycena haematopus]
MPKGKPISVDLRWAIVRMHPLFSLDKLAAYTGVSSRQIQRIMARFRVSGDVLSATQRKKTGRTRHLTSNEVAFLHGCLDLSCDQYLDELQQALVETCGRYVSLSTVWRALKRSGYTMMKVEKVFGRSPALLPYA